jgi:2',3'-cyclic-nucleotide 2'-phosphodiesterase (5'-nucleotidase family)
VTVSILCTNDFAGTWDPTPTSFGTLPGARGLQCAVDEMRSRGPALWVDAGDLVDGGVLAADGGRLGWQAAAELGIDVAVPGNHEFDWGLDHLRAQVATSGLAYACANADIGVPPARIAQTSEAAVGFIGLTYPALEQVSPGLLGSAQQPLDELVPPAARSLRADGCEYVVAVLHDGVPGPWPDGEPDNGVFFGFLGQWYRCVDAVIGGHTLWRALVAVNGVAFCQPTAFGAEIGVVELGHPDGPRLRSLSPEPAGMWDGSGSDELAKARAEVLAEVSRPVTATLDGHDPFFGTLAAAMRSRTGADVALVSPWDCYVVQPVHHDKIALYLPIGAFTRADLLRLTSQPDDPVVVLTLESSQLGALRDRLLIPFLPALGVAGAAPPQGRVAVALTARQAQHAQRWLGPDDQPSIPDATATFADILTEVIGRW